jgi:hypothetical protein
VLVQDVRCSGNLRHEMKSLAQGELVVLQGVCADVVRATQMQQEERRPEGHQLVLARQDHGAASEGQVAKGVCRSHVGQLVGQPQKDRPPTGCSAPACTGEEEEDGICGKAGKNDDAEPPFVPELRSPTQPRSHYCELLPYPFTGNKVQNTFIDREFLLAVIETKLNHSQNILEKHTRWVN